MDIRLKKTIYPIDIVIRAAYVFTNDGYIYIDEDEECFIVSIEPKESNSFDSIEGEFKNELLAQMLRKSVSDRTKGIREIIYQRALSSSMISSECNDSEEYIPEEDFDLKMILKDWFAEE